MGSLALFAAVSDLLGQMRPAGAALWAHPRAALGIAEDSLATASRESGRNAAANEAEATQTARNMRDAKEMADAPLAEAEAEAERLTKLPRRSARISKSPRQRLWRRARRLPARIQELEDDATAKDAELTSITTAYEATRAAYANSTAAIVTLGEELKTAKAASEAASAVHDKDLATATTAKKTADDLSKQAHALNAKTQADPKTGEVTAEEAKKRAEEVATAAGKAKAARSRAPRRRRRTRRMRLRTRSSS